MGLKAVLPKSMIVLVAVATFATACGNDSEETQTGAPAGQDAPVATPSGDVPATTTTLEPASPAMPPAQTETASAEPSGDEVAHLADVRIARHNNVDRITFQFDGPVPGYEIGYATLPPRQDGTGAEVPLNGDSGLSVRFKQASAVSLTGGFSKTYNGPERLTGPGTQTVIEAVQVSDYEGSLVWAVGTKSTAPFAVQKASDPSRVFIDIG